jgi:hypothetical protein
MTDSKDASLLGDMGEKLGLWNSFIEQQSKLRNFNRRQDFP